MSSNFLDASGLMAGADIHTWYTIAPSALPAPVPSPHIVADSFYGIQRYWRVVWSVTSDACPMLQSNWCLLVVPHIPIPAGPPHPAEVPNYLTIVATSSSSPQLSVHSVTGKGAALYCCVIFCISRNLNCGVPAWLTGSVLNLNTVKTTPSLGDYLAAAVGTVLNALYTTGTSAIPINSISIGYTIFQNVMDGLNAAGWGPGDPIGSVISQIQTAAQEWADK